MQNQNYIDRTTGNKYSTSAALQSSQSFQEALNHIAMKARRTKDEENAINEAICLFAKYHSDVANPIREAYLLACTGDRSKLGCRNGQHESLIEDTSRRILQLEMSGYKVGSCDSIMCPIKRSEIAEAMRNLLENEPAPELPPAYNPTHENNINKQTGFISGEKETIQWLRKIGVENFSLRSKRRVWNQETREFDTTDSIVVDVAGNVNLKGKLGSFRQLPVQFGIVSGHFDISNNNSLATLKGSPSKVRSFKCDYTKIKSLENGPKEVETFYFSRFNVHLESLMGAPEVVPETFSTSQCQKLTTLAGGPKKVGNFYSKGSGLQSLEHAPEVTMAEGVFECSYCKLTSLEGLKLVRGDLNAAGNNLRNLEGADNVHGPINIDRNISWYGFPNTSKGIWVGDKADRDSEFIPASAILEVLKPQDLDIIIKNGESADIDI